MELTAALNAIAGTTGLEAQGAANVIAGTDGLALVGALNAEATPVGVVGYQPTKLRTPGTSGNYASCPRTAAIAITGDIDIRWVGSLDDWTPAAYNVLIGRYMSTGNLRSWMLTIDTTTGKPKLYWSTNGTALANLVASTAPTVSDGAVLGIRATLDVDNGASAYTATFYTSDDLGETWVQLGTPQTSGAPTSIYDAPGIELEIGGRNSNTGNQLTGYTIRAEVRNGINGTVVANPDFTSDPALDGYAPDGAGNTWTLNGTAALANDGAAIPSVSGESPRLELQGVLNQLAGTTGLGVNAAATIWAESV